MQNEPFPKTATKNLSRSDIDIISFAELKQKMRIIRNLKNKDLCKKAGCLEQPIQLSVDHCLYI